MNTPIIWIAIPAIFSFITLFLRRYEKPILIIGTAFTAFLGLAALLIPRAWALDLGIVNIQIVDTLSVFGRQFILGIELRNLTGLIYLAAALWFGGAYFAQAPALVVPIGTLVVALSIAALSVEPFLYAPLFIEVAVLVSVPLMVPVGNGAGPGIIRYIVFQTLGMPFILIAGWMLSTTGVELTGTGIGLSLGVTLGLGFAFLMAIFPLHTWIPMLAEEVHPYVLSFILFFLPLVSTLFGLKLLTRYPSILASSSDVPSLVLLVGAIMAGIGGFWIAFQRHLARMMAFALVTDIGLVLLMFGAAAQRDASLPTGAIIMALSASRGLSLAVWSLALSVLTGSAYGTPLKGFHFHEAQGAAKRYPISATGLVLAHLSMAGFPLLAGFPVRFGSFEILAGISPWISLVAIIASVGVVIGALRTTAVLVMGEDENDVSITENSGQRMTLLVGILALILIGLFPQWFIALMEWIGISFLNAAL